MIEPTTNDVGRIVVYDVITSFNKYTVFVRYGIDLHSKGTDRRDLIWANEVIEHNARLLQSDSKTP